MIRIYPKNTFYGKQFMSEAEQIESRHVPKNTVFDSSLRQIGYKAGSFLKSIFDTASNKIPSPGYSWKRA